METKFKRVKNGAELLAFLQTLSPEELALPIARTDNGPDYGPFYDEIDEVTITQVPIHGWRQDYEWCIVF